MHFSDKKINDNTNIEESAVNSDVCNIVDPDEIRLIRIKFLFKNIFVFIKSRFNESLWRFNSRYFREDYRFHKAVNPPDTNVFSRLNKKSLSYFIYTKAFFRLGINSENFLFQQKVLLLSKRRFRFKMFVKSTTVNVKDRA